MSVTSTSGIETHCNYSLARSFFLQYHQLYLAVRGKSFVKILILLSSSYISVIFLGPFQLSLMNSAMECYDFKN